MNENVVNLPDGWTITEPEDSLGPYLVRIGDVPVASIQFDVRSYSPSLITGDWSWRGLSGAGSMAPWSWDRLASYEDAVADVIKRLTDHDG